MVASGIHLFFISFYVLITIILPSLFLYFNILHLFL